MINFSATRLKYGCSGRGMHHSHWDPQYEEGTGIHDPEASVVVELHNARCESAPENRESLFTSTMTGKPSFAITKSYYPLKFRVQT